MSPMMVEKVINVVSVSWYSSGHIKRLVNNLLDKAENPETLTFTIIDNTNGTDMELKEVLSDMPSLTILYNKSEAKQRSVAHASALDVAMSKLETYFTLVVDPDVHIFKEGWDSFCQSKIESGQSAVGAPYPKWKLGKVHDFPSVVFIFSSTEWFTREGKSWHPFPPFWRRVWNFFVRKFVRLFRFATRQRLENSRLMRTVTSGLEAMTGITSPDTGLSLVKAAKERGDASIFFEAPYSSGLPDPMVELARNFELFFYSSEPFMSHMYSSGISYYRTEKSGDLNAWISAVEQVERSLN